MTTTTPRLMFTPFRLLDDDVERIAQRVAAILGGAPPAIENTVQPAAPLVRYVVRDAHGEPIAVRDSFDEAAAYMVARSRAMAAQPVNAAERRMSIDEVHERPVNA